MSAQTINWEQYQQLPAGKRSRPLTDAEYAALTKQQRIAGGLDENDEGAPANFNGPVFPNPTHIQPRADTDPAIDPTRLPEGVTFQRQNFSGTPQMDVSNPAAADVQPEMGREVAANFGKKMSAQPIDFSKYEQAAPPGGNQIDFSKYEQGAGTPQAQEPSFWDTLKREGKSMTGTIAGMPAAVYHAFSEPATQEEKDKFGGEDQVTGAKRIGLGIHRLALAPAENAADWYGQAVKGEIPNAYEQALSVAPEAIGSSAGNVVGGKLIEMAPGAARTVAEAVPPAVRATARGVNTALQNAPGAVGGAVGGTVGAAAGHASGIPGGLLVGEEIGRNLGTAAGRSVLPKVRVPGEGFGLPNRVTGGPEVAPQYEAPAEGEAAPEEPAQPLPKPKAKTVKQSTALGPNAQPLTQAQSLSQPRTIVTDPATGRPEFSDVVETKQQAAAPIETKAPQTETPAPQVAPQGTPAETPGPAADDLLERLKGVASRIQKQEAAEPGSAAPDMLQQLQDSLDIVKARKAVSGTKGDLSGIFQRLVKGEAGQAGLPGSVTNADEGIAEIQNRPVIAQKTQQVPARGYLKVVGADENSVLKTPRDQDSVLYHQQQIAHNGPPDVELHLDEGGNVIGAQGRHRALAAAQQGSPVNVTVYQHSDPTAP